jgi:hypothetical protein
MEELVKEFEKCKVAVTVIQQTDAQNLYDKLKKAVEGWMANTGLIGKVEIPISIGIKNGSDVKIIFQFPNSFDIKTDFDDYFYFGLFFRNISPNWSIPFVKVAIFLKYLGEIIESLKKEFWELRENLSKLVEFV